MIWMRSTTYPTGIDRCLIWMWSMITVRRRQRFNEHVEGTFHFRLVITLSKRYSVRWILGKNELFFLKNNRSQISSLLSNLGSTHWMDNFAWESKPAWHRTRPNPDFLPILLLCIKTSWFQIIHSFYCSFKDSLTNIRKASFSSTKE